MHSARRRSALSPSLSADPWRPGHPSPWRPGRRRLPRNLQAAAGATSFPPQPPPRRAARLRCGGGGGSRGEHLSPRAPAARRPPPCSLPQDPAVEASQGSRRAVARPAHSVAARAQRRGPHGAVARSGGAERRREACRGAQLRRGEAAAARAHGSSDSEGVGRRGGIAAARRRRQSSAPLPQLRGPGQRSSLAFSLRLECL